MISRRLKGDEFKLIYYKIKAKKKKKQNKKKKKQKGNNEIELKKIPYNIAKKMI